MTDHVAIVTGANHGIGAGTARALAANGVAVLSTYLRPADPPDPAQREEYRTNRAATADRVVGDIVAAGGRALAMEADLSDPATSAALFDRAEADLGPADILVNNASGWVQDTFTPVTTDRFGRTMRGVSYETWSRQFAVDAMAPALLIAEFARRHVARGATWGRLIGLTSGGPAGFPTEVSYGAAKAAQENYVMSAAQELAPYGITANIVYPPVTDTGWVNDEVRRAVAEGATHTHIATGEEVGRVIAYLASEAADLISGSVVRMR
ncbi:MAG: SDR family NAD(P)-dependent oxidoreductase [Mycobacteriales bacterium]